MLFIEFESLCQKLWVFLSNFGYFTMPGHQIWSVTRPKMQISNFFYFVLILHVLSGKVTKFPVEKLSASEVISKKPHRGGVENTLKPVPLGLTNFDRYHCH